MAEHKQLRTAIRQGTNAGTKAYVEPEPQARFMIKRGEEEVWYTDGAVAIEAWENDWSGAELWTYKTADKTMVRIR